MAKNSNWNPSCSVLISVALALCTTALPLIAAPVDSLKQQAAAQVDKLAPDIGRAAEQIWWFAELPWHETRSSALLADKLQREGFKVQRGVAQIPTAFVASYGTGKPVIAVLAEYDAIPDAGNAISPGRTPRPDGVTNGHGCGHNLLGSASVGAAIALKRLMATHGLQGTIKLFGTPAEERGSGKLYMAKAGLFDGLDAAIHWHPAPVTTTAQFKFSAADGVRIEFFGQEALPGQKRSARAGLEMTTYGINLLREYLPPTTVIRYDIAEAGRGLDLVNPGYARLTLIIEDFDKANVQAAYQRVVQITEGAAKAMGVEQKVTLSSSLHATLVNRPLNKAMQANLERLGPISYEEAEQKFARQLQKAFGIEETGFDATVLPMPEEPAGGGFVTDVAEVSWNAPTVGFAGTSAPTGIPSHSWAAAASYGSPGGKKGAVFAAKAIALMGVDLLTDAGLLEKAKAAFRESTGGRPYIPGIPLDQKPPLEDPSTP